MRMSVYSTDADRYSDNEMEREQFKNLKGVSCVSFSVMESFCQRTLEATRTKLNNHAESNRELYTSGLMDDMKASSYKSSFPKVSQERIIHPASTAKAVHRIQPVLLLLLSFLSPSKCLTSAHPQIG